MYENENMKQFQEWGKENKREDGGGELIDDIL
jgi:hypothetical protein